MARLLKAYPDFRGGLNKDAAPDNLADNELMEAENADLDERGAVSQRKGTKPLLANSGTCPAQTGMTSTQITLASGASASDDYYNGYPIVITGGTGEGQTRTIADYTGASKLVTVGTAWTTQPDNTSTYEIPVNYGAQVERIIEWPRKDGTKVLLAVIGSNLCKIGTDNKPTVLQALASADIGFYSYADVFYFCDGSEYYYYDGTNVYKVQLATPGSAPTLGNSGGGSPLGAGTFKGKVVFYNSLGYESVASAEATVTILVGEQIDWSAIPIGPTGTVGRKLYRTTVGGSAFKLLTTIADNTTTTYTDIIADASLGAALVIDNNLTPIKRCRRFIWHPKSQRIFAARDSSDMAALYYSEAGQPEYFKETNILYPTTGDGPVYALTYIADAMVTVYQSSEWAWKGVDPDTDAEWYKLPSNYGSKAHMTVALTPNGLTFLSEGAIISLSPGLIDSNIAMIAGEELVANRTKNLVSSIIRGITNYEIAAAVFDTMNDKHMLAYTNVASATRNSRILVLDWNLQRFTEYVGLAVNGFCLRSNGDLLMAMNGYIVKANQDIYDDWDPDTANYKAISYKVVPKAWNLDHPFHIKKIKKMFLAARQYELFDSSINIILYMDYQYYELTVLTLSSLSLDESFVWGKEWGLPWGWSDLITKEAKVRGKGLRVKVVMTNSERNEPVTIYGLAFEFILKKPRGVKV